MNDMPTSCKKSFKEKNKKFKIYWNKTYKNCIKKNCTNVKVEHLRWHEITSIKNDSMKMIIKKKYTKWKDENFACMYVFNFLSYVDDCYFLHFPKVFYWS